MLGNKTFLFLSFATLILFLAINGATIGFQGDDVREIPEYIKAVDQAAYPVDYVLKGKPSYKASLYYYFITFLAKYLDIYFLSTLINIVFKFSIFYLLFKLVNYLFRLNLYDNFLFILILTFCSYLRGLFTNLFPSHDDLSFIFILLSLLFFLKDKKKLAYIFCGISFNFQAGYAMLFFLGLSFAQISTQKSIKEYLKPAVLFGLFSLPVILLNLPTLSNLASHSFVLAPEHPFNWWDKFMRAIHLDHGLIKVLWHDLNVHLITGLIIFLFLREEKTKKFALVGRIFIFIFLATILVSLLCEFLPLKILTHFAIPRKGRDLMRIFLLISYLYFIVKSFRKPDKPGDYPKFALLFMLLLRKLFFLGSLLGLALKTRLSKKLTLVLFILGLIFIKFVPWQDFALERSDFPAVLLTKPVEGFSYLANEFLSLSYLASNPFIFFPLLLLLLSYPMKLLKKKAVYTISLTVLAVVVIYAGLVDRSIYMFSFSGERTFIHSFDRELKNELKSFVQVQTWAKANTRKDALFLVPPYIPGFRVYSQRSIFLDLVDWGYLHINNNEELAGEYWQRLNELIPSFQAELEQPLDFVEHFKPTRPLEITQRITEKYKNLPLGVMEDIVEKYNIDYLVFELQHDRGKFLGVDKYLPVFKNKSFIVYEVYQQI